MCVVKQKSGYRITCTDSEFEVLSLMVQHGAADLEGPEHRTGLTLSAKRAYAGVRFQQSAGPLTIDDDRRIVAD